MGTFVVVKDGRGVWVGPGVDVEEAIGVNVGGNIWLATDLPNKVAAIVIANSTNETSSHC